MQRPCQIRAIHLRSSGRSFDNIFRKFQIVHSIVFNALSLHRYISLYLVFRFTKVAWMLSKGGEQFNAKDLLKASCQSGILV